MTKKILLLGSGELGKEFVIAAKRLGQYVVACDSYAGAPAMQVADACEVFDMLDGDRLEAVVAKHDPDIIVPEIEAIRTERLYACEKRGYPGRAERACSQLHDEPQVDPRPGRRRVGAENSEILLRQVVRRTESRRRTDRFPVRRQAADVLLGQRAVAGAHPRRTGTRLGIRVQRQPRRHPRTHHRGVHPLRQRDHAAHRHAAERPHALLPADRPCPEGRRLPRELPARPPSRPSIWPKRRRWPPKSRRH